MHKKEIWKQVDLNLDFDVDFSLQVSNFGNLRSINKNNEYKIVKASKLRSFRTINRTFYKPRTTTQQRLVNKKQKEINNLKNEIKVAKNEIKKLKYKTKERATFRDYIVQLEKDFHKKKKAYDLFLIEERKNRAVVRCWLLHKLVATYFCAQKDKLHTNVIHIDRNKENNYASNLKWVSTDEAYLYSFENKQQKQKKKPYALTIEKVKAIKNDLKNTMVENTQELMKKYKASLSQIRRIKNLETWKFVKD